jgi:hypothetical protein
MKRILLIVFAALSIGAQESTLPPDHYCMAGPPLPSQKPKAHECHCRHVCDVDENGNPVERESQECKVYCHRDRCNCHKDQSCTPPKG